MAPARWVLKVSGSGRTGWSGTSLPIILSHQTVFSQKLIVSSSDPGMECMAQKRLGSLNFFQRFSTALELVALHSFSVLHTVCLSILHQQGFRNEPSRWCACGEPVSRSAWLRSTLHYGEDQSRCCPPTSASPVCIHCLRRRISPWGRHYQVWPLPACFRLDVFPFSFIAGVGVIMGNNFRGGELWRTTRLIVLLWFPKHIYHIYHRKFLLLCCFCCIPWTDWELFGKRCADDTKTLKVRLIYFQLEKRWTT